METPGITTLVADLQATLHLSGELVREVEALEPFGAKRTRAGELAQALRCQPNLAALPTMLLRAYSGVTAALGGIRMSRETIENHAVDRLRHTHVKLVEVSSATESAASAMLDGLDRALAMIEQLGAVPPGSGPDGRPLTDALRDELNGLFSVLQFQDITAQQLRTATDLLQDVEQRLLAVASLFDPETTQAGSTAVPEVLADLSLPACPTHDPAATTRAAGQRQAVADAIMARAATARWQLAGT